jgi:tRNA/rRNA methyltransferase
MILEKLLKALIMINNPKIILVRPQMQENVGATARAMANFALSDLYLVNPREALEDKAYAMSSGATDILDNVKHYDSVHNAIAQCQFVMATTARNRGINKPAYSVEDAIKLILEKQAQGNECGILFGPERTGLENDDLMLADCLIHVPVNPEFASLNLAQCVLLVAYEYFKQYHKNNFTYISTEPSASKQDTDNLIKHLVDELDNSKFFFPIEKRPSSVTLISNIFSRNQLTEQEVRTLRGIIKALVK